MRYLLYCDGLEMNPPYLWGMPVVEFESAVFSSVIYFNAIFNEKFFSMVRLNCVTFFLPKWDPLVPVVFLDFVCGSILTYFESELKPASICAQGPAGGYSTFKQLRNNSRMVKFDLINTPNEISIHLELFSRQKF